MPSSLRFLTVRMFSLLLLLFFHLRACHSSPSMHPLCHDEESRALLQFKQSLAINESASSDPSAYPKVASWKVDGESRDCCSWDGVECERDSGHVIGLNLRSSCLYGSIDSNSSLFHLVHLKRLNLADNNFNNSEIPSEIRNLPRLFDLDLSHSSFSGQIPAEILELSKLVSIDLGLNSLKLQKPGLQHLVESLTNLEVLHLSEVNISAKVPQIMANLSSLSSLFLRDCGLQGEFPMGIFQLPNLRFLSIWHNPYLTGYLPEFQSGSQLELLLLGGTSFSGQLPESIGNLKSLKEFLVAECYFSGAIPSSLGNLTKLNSLDLSFNNFTSGTLDWLGNLTKLNLLSLTQTNSYGNIPSSIRNMAQLSVLELARNKLTGQFPSWIGNLSQLIILDLGANKLHGPIPGSIYRLQNLEFLSLSSNFFNGTMDLNLLLKFRNLVTLQLSGNLSLLNSQNATFPQPKLKLLILNGCNLGEFPSFLRYQNHLEFLYLNKNNLEGHIPKWFMDMSTMTLESLSLAGNFLTGFEQSFDILPWNKLRSLHLYSNKFQGSLPVPPQAIFEYKVRNNKFAGEIPKVFCNLASLSVLELSNNNLSGKLPPCLGNKSSTISVLNLGDNSFSGDIRETFTSGCSLRVVDFSQNKLEGKIPRSLANCTKLEILNLEQNKINDVFPSWLGILPDLRVLILRSNRLHGVIGKPRNNVVFPRVQIVDLSNNSFMGNLPLEYFRNWTAMKNVHGEHLAYMQANTSFQMSHIIMTSQYEYSMTMTNKGLCGKPLPGKCSDGEDSLPAPKEDEGSESPLEFGGKAVAIGYAAGLVIGVIIGCIMNTREYEWLVNNYLQNMPSSLRFLTVRMFSLLLLLFFHLRACHSSPSMHPLCHDEESHALLQFKQSLAINESASYDPSAYPKVASVSRDINAAIKWKQNSSNSDQSKQDIQQVKGNNTAANQRLIEANQQQLIGNNNTPHCNSFHTNSFPVQSIFFPQPKLQVLKLNGCNFGAFPSLLHDQNHLELLELEQNKLEGHIPKWFMNMSTMTLEFLSLAGNFLTGFEQSFEVLPWKKLLSLNLHSNKLHGSLPTTSPAIYEYEVSNNKFTGEILKAFCNLASLSVLELSHNNLSGKLPPCLGNKSSTILVLNLGDNSFSGDIPETFISGCSLTVVDFNQNKLEGKIPRSLANCTKLEILNLEQNKINDVFPSWLGILPDLRVLILRSNRLHGVIGKPKNNVEFPRVQIVVLSHNRFKGNLPLEYFRNWTAMKNVHSDHFLHYMYGYSMRMTNKGVVIFYEKIQDSLTAIDLSCNDFEGEIPVVLGDLKALHLLNLSNNFLSGGIPPSLSNLTQLESLDLSQNKLSGNIPVQLAQLNFLEVLNVSHNFLSGPIPQGNQFDTFDNTSFDANSGLCGKPLSGKCRDGEDSLPAPREDEGSESPLEFGWKAMVTGYAAGLVIGVLIGSIMNTREYEWLVNNYFVRLQRKGQNLKTRLHRS
ncbi:hypothetical protein SADUNF_Sadunf16G0107100 [Salix dunnii]|uniref:Leucine-rich repeat-containing N-terminal plant-type domain-containing protein n=1 Tax=Salix dunnii TaxID=1413687 RepID=A0A835MPX2_9ROSI|nr:hypothetical protein SADUNF_Sadunf16G0107100 [Salix dunnii]